MQYVWASLLPQVLMVLLQVLLVAFLAWVHSFIPMLRNWLQHHLTQKERAILYIVAREACTLAETVYRQAGGPEKLNYAMDYAVSVLQKRGIQVSSQEVRATIEQALAAANNGSVQREQP